MAKEMARPRECQNRRPLTNSFSLIRMNFVTHPRACSLNPENSAQGPQTVHDLPTKVGLFALPGRVPRKVHNGRSNVLFKGLNRLLFLLGLWALLFLLACGKKGPPVAPRAVVPPAVQDLKAELVGGEVQLTWSIPTKNGAAFEGIEGFRVFRRNVHDSVAPCPGCPLPFDERLDIKLEYPEPARVEGGRLIYLDKVAPDGRYAYKIIVYHKSGGVSRDSNVVFCPKPDSTITTDG
jgi:hypothetical protein